MWQRKKWLAGAISYFATMFSNVACCSRRKKALLCGRMMFHSVPTEDDAVFINGYAKRVTDLDTRCGIGRFRPEILQVFVRMGVFIGVYGISGLLTSTLSFYVNSQVPMLEHQFGFSSAETGFLVSCNDIGYMTCVILAGYIARKVHIPRGLGISTMLYGVCGLLCALPYFIQDPSTYEFDENMAGLQMSANVSFAMPMGTNVQMCLNGTMLSEDMCSVVKGSVQGSASVKGLYIKRVSYCLIAIGMVLQGFGKCCRTPFVTIYIDDAVDKRKTGLYLGILTGIGIFGPALAYVLGGLFSKVYVTLKPVAITPTDPRWIGAWWLGFLIFGAGAIFCSVPLMCFPRTMKSTSGMKNAELRDNVNKKVKLSTTQTVKHGLIDFLQTVGRLLRNPVFITITLSSCVNLLGVAGVLSFMPKYLAAQYTIPLWQTNIILALSNICAVSLGSFLGGVFSCKVEMAPQSTLKLLILFCVVNIVCLSSGFFLGCDQPSLVGDNGKGNFSQLSPLYHRVEESCIQGCTCEDESYFPVCGDDGRSYFSPCHAGCTAQSGMEFINCTCISNGHAVGGLCDQGCSTKLYIYAAFTFIGKLFEAFKIIPILMASIRCVEDRDRAPATAFLGFVNSALGWMPGPVLFGAIIDGTCSLWKYTCGQRQSCLLYDIVFFRKAINGYEAVATTISVLMLVMLYIRFRVKGVTQWRNGVQTPKLIHSENHDVAELSNM